MVLARKQVGPTVAFYFLVVERLSDLLVANMIFFLLSILRSDLTISFVNVFGFFFGFIGLVFLIHAVKIKPSFTESFSFSELFRNVDIIFGKKSILQLFVSLVGSWVLTTAALLILSLRNSDLLQDWISVNSSYTDPYSIILNLKPLLYVTLALPLVLAYAYSLTIPSPKSIAKKTLKEFMGTGSNLRYLSPLVSRYAGSGASLFLAGIRSSEEVSDDVYLVRVELITQDSTNSSLFMINAEKDYNFPNIHFVRDFSNSKCTIQECITDSNSNLPSKNAFEVIIESDRDYQAFVMDNLVSHIIGFHKPLIAEDRNHFKDISKQMIVDSIENRINRSCAYVFLAVNPLNSSNRLLYSRIKRVGDSLSSQLRKFEDEIRIGNSHGDASMSNFLLQFEDSGMKIRSIDPNPRFQIANLEYDLAKVMQTTHGLYEFLISDSSNFPDSLENFQIARSNLGLSILFDRAIDKLEHKYPINHNLMRLFFMVHLFRIAPYKVQDASDELERYFRLILWVCSDADF
jgi:hypothetical protein